MIPVVVALFRWLLRLVVIWLLYRPPVREEVVEALPLVAVVLLLVLLVLFELGREVDEAKDGELL